MSPEDKPGMFDNRPIERDVYNAIVDGLTDRIKELEEAMQEFVLLCEPWGALGYEPSMHSIIKTADKFKELLE